MTYEELKAKAIEEELDISFDTSYGGYNSRNIYRESNGYFCVCYHDERGKCVAEYPGLPEEEACEKIYKNARAKKVLEKYYAEVAGKTV